MGRFTFLPIKLLGMLWYERGFCLFSRSLPTCDLIYESLNFRLVSVVMFLCLFQRSQSCGVSRFFAILNSLSLLRICRFSSVLNYGLSFELIEKHFCGIEALAAFIRASVKFSVALSRSQSNKLSQSMSISILVSLSISVRP